MDYFSLLTDHLAAQLLGGKAIVEGAGLVGVLGGGGAPEDLNQLGVIDVSVWKGWAGVSLYRGVTYQTVGFFFSLSFFLVLNTFLLGGWGV